MISDETRRSLNLYVKEIDKYGVLTDDEFNAIYERIKNGDNEARNILIQHNLKLVVKIAHDFKGLGLPLSDLIGAGNIGLIKSIDNYKREKNTKFSTYASLWIKAYIRRELTRCSRAVSLREGSFHKMSKAIKLADKNYSVDDIANEINVKNKSKIHELINGYSEFSLNEPVISDEAKERGELFSSNEPSPVSVLEKSDIIERIIDYCENNLSDRDKYIIYSRYGLNGHDIKTQSDIAREFDLKHQRIQQIERDVLDKIKKAFSTEKLLFF